MYISYCSQVCKHLKIQYPINPAANTYSNYDAGIQNKNFRRPFNSLRGRRQIGFLVRFFKSAREKNTQRPGRGRPSSSFSGRTRASSLYSKKKMAPAILFQNLLVMHVSHNRCQKAYLLILQSKTANSHFSN